MAAVAIAQGVLKSFGIDLSARGYNVVYRNDESNRCPGCGRASWYVGRVTAECGFCGTALALAEAKWGASGTRYQPSIVEPASQRAVVERLTEEADWAERRRDERMEAAGRVLQLLVDGAPHAFTVRNISTGGLMGDAPVGLVPAKPVQVQFEDGQLVEATVRWHSGRLAGLAFHSPRLDAPRKS